MTEPRTAPALQDWMKHHIARYLATDGEEGYLWDAGLGGGEMVPTLLLTTIGRKSGVPLTLPLIFSHAGDDYAVIASKGGSPEHPSWYLNLQANPEVQVQVKGDKFRARARTASPAERAALWRQMAAIYPPYDDYQASTDREIPVIVLERI